MVNFDAALSTRCDFVHFVAREKWQMQAALKIIRLYLFNYAALYYLLYVGL